MQRSFRTLFWTLAIAGLTIDLASKYVVFRALSPDARDNNKDLVPGWFQFVTQFQRDDNTGDPIPIETGWRGPLQALNSPIMPRVNQGALFGFGHGMKHGANGFFTIVSIAAALVIIGWSLRGKNLTDGVFSAALGLILGGTLGNLFDRVVFHGVRDFMYFYRINYPVFNFADCCLVAGAGLLLIQALMPAPKENGQPQETRELAHAE